MADYQAIGAATGAELVLEAVIACRDVAGAPSADPAIMRQDVALVREAAAAAGIRFAKVAVSPACDLKCTLPGSVWPACPPLEEIYAAAREAFPEAEDRRRHVLLLHRAQPQAAARRGARLRGPQQLPDRARRRRQLGDGDARGAAPRDRLDPQLHRRQAVPGRAERARRARQSLRRRHRAQPDNGRIALSRWIRASAACLGAAWYLGYPAHMARGGVDAVCLGAPVGELGVIDVRSDYPQPWFDQQPPRSIRPTTCCAAWRRRPAARGSRPSCRTARRCRRWPGRRRAAIVLWLANLTGTAQTVALEGLPGGAAGSRGSTGQLRGATADPDALPGSRQRPRTAGSTRPLRGAARADRALIRGGSRSRCAKKRPGSG